MKRALVLLALAACGGGSSDEVCSPPGDGPGFDPAQPFCTHLSSYRLFDDIAAQTPAAGVTPYALNTALFSDYASKHRFLYVPAGATIGWQDEDVLDIPVGSILVKTFQFGDQLVETRLLIHQDSGWTGAAYTYDADGQDATLNVAGTTAPVDVMEPDGSTEHDDYVVPNKNQCKNCHEDHTGTFEPLGPKARHINRDGQLEDLVARGVLTGAPADSTTWPKAPVFDDPTTGTLDERARGYLDVNCAHCHNPEGAARTSGLDLRHDDADPFHTGICKPPTAAGLGSGGFSYVIVPGMPDQSILIYRISSTDAEIKMPELARNLVHKEGVQLVTDWITSLTGTCQ